MTIHARIYDPQAAALRKLAKRNRRPVSTEVHIAVEKHLRKPASVVADRPEDTVE